MSKHQIYSIVIRVLVALGATWFVVWGFGDQFRGSPRFVFAMMLLALSLFIGLNVALPVMLFAKPCGFGLVKIEQDEHHMHVESRFGVVMHIIGITMCLALFLGSPNSRASWQEWAQHWSTSPRELCFLAVALILLLTLAWLISDPVRLYIDQDTVYLRRPLHGLFVMKISDVTRIRSRSVRFNTLCWLGGKAVRYYRFRAGRYQKQKQVKWVQLPFSDYSLPEVYDVEQFVRKMQRAQEESQGLPVESR